MDLRAALAQAEKAKLAALDEWISATGARAEAACKKRFDEAEGRYEAIKAKMVRPLSEAEKHTVRCVQKWMRIAERGDAFERNAILREVIATMKRCMDNGGMPRDPIGFAMMLLVPLVNQHSIAQERMEHLLKRIEKLEGKS
jgi:hypothetical protein